MSSTISARDQTFSPEGYAIQAQWVRKKASAVNDNGLRDQLLDLARHYDFLAHLATSANRNCTSGNRPER